MPQPKTSLIILAFNEEKNIRACLDAVSKQTIMPDEVLVINNNSIDKTVEIASEYSFVRIVNEKEQGMIPARNRGFNVATGDILMRIDADSYITPHWTSAVLSRFSQKNIDGVTGYGSARWPSFVGASLLASFFSRIYFSWYGALFGAPMLWGANMALTKESWLGVKDVVCLDSKIVHEDQDISLWMAKKGFKNVFENKMNITHDAINVLYLPSLFRYMRLQYSTSVWHWKNNGYMSPINTLPSRIFKLALFSPVYVLFLFVCSLSTLTILLNRICVKNK